MKLSYGIVYDGGAVGKLWQLFRGMLVDLTFDPVFEIVCVNFGIYLFVWWTMEFMVAAMVVPAMEESSSGWRNLLMVTTMYTLMYVYIEVGEYNLSFY